MHARNCQFRRVWGVLLAVMAGAGLLASCTLCTKRLYLDRDTAEKSLPPAGMVLMITEPDLANAVLSAPIRTLGDGCQWAAEKLAHEADAYTLSIDNLDGQPVYQGLCLDTTPTYACEVRPGTRQVRVRLDMFGVWGHERKREVANLTLEPGGCYFLRPDCEALKTKSFILRVERLPDAYTPELRARLIDWKRRHTKGTYTAE